MVSNWLPRDIARIVAGPGFHRLGATVTRSAYFRNTRDDMLATEGVITPLEGGTSFSQGGVILLHDSIYCKLYADHFEVLAALLVPANPKGLKLPSTAFRKAGRPAATSLPDLRLGHDVSPSLRILGNIIS